MLTSRMQQVLQGLERARRTPMTAMSPEQARSAYAAGANVLEPPLDPVARIENWQLPTRDGTPIAARAYYPSDLPRHPVLVFFHGGGFMVGSIETHEAFCRAIAALSGIAVVSVDYRLAPEHRFPTAVNDAWDALAWIAEHGAAHGLDPARLALAGDSAGGTLATVCATLARDAHLPIALQALIYPGTDMNAQTKSRERFAEGFVLSQSHIEYFFNHYLAPAERADWRASPLYTPDLSGVAPVWMGLAECDPLVDEGIAYADALRMAGVAVDLTIYRGVTHEFMKMGRTVPEALQLRRDLSAALKQVFSTD